MQEIVEMMEKMGMILRIIDRFQSPPTTVTIYTALQAHDRFIQLGDVREFLRLMERARMVECKHPGDSDSVWVAKFKPH